VFSTFSAGQIGKQSAKFSKYLLDQEVRTDPGHQAKSSQIKPQANIPAGVLDLSRPLSTIFCSLLLPPQNPLPPENQELPVSVNQETIENQKSSAAAAHRPTPAR